MYCMYIVYITFDIFNMSTIEFMYIVCRTFDTFNMRNNVLNQIYYACFYFFWHLWHAYQFHSNYSPSSPYMLIYTYLFAHNFLTIQPIFNPLKVLKSWDLGLSNQTIKYYVCWSMLKVSKVKNKLQHLWDALIYIAFDDMVGKL